MIPELVTISASTVKKNINPAEISLIIFSLIVIISLSVFVIRKKITHADTKVSKIDE
jgi:hypothetical protein